MMLTVSNLSKTPKIARSQLRQYVFFLHQQMTQLEAASDYAIAFRDQTAQELNLSRKLS
ncbi:MAG: hypothetical protein AAGF66_17080 [Cyanobacteria bacterium P01_H01_bin.119]